jgi:hypothetical protein
MSRAKKQAQRDMDNLRAKYGHNTVELHSPEAEQKRRKKLGAGTQAYKNEQARLKRLEAADKAAR